jgi:hypothetical protein
VCNEDFMVEMIRGTEDQTRGRAIPAWRKGRSHMYIYIKDNMQELYKQTNNTLWNKGQNMYGEMEK